MDEYSRRAHEIHVPRPGDRCGSLEKDSPSWAAFHIAFFLSSYVVPLILISVLYMWMLSRLWRSSVGGRSAESKKGKKRVTRLVVIVVAAFASLWFPIQHRDDNHHPNSSSETTPWPIPFDIISRKSTRDPLTALQNGHNNLHTVDPTE
uniref:G-protein coupled receptors family 1 profile domain-containing protein n=1 Tax=Anopheles quadriannulatus TaxID=34691 RepID=A0A182X2U5_ANOQN